MRVPRPLASLLAPAVALLALAGCGGSQPAALHGGRQHSTRFLAAARSARFAPGRFSLAPSLPGYDAVTVSAVPSGAPVVGCYVSGSFANCGTARADFPRARLVTIATWAGAAAKILDTEPGDAVPSQDAGWIRWMLSRGVYRPGIYADASEMVQVRADLAAAGIPRADYVLWVAAWDGVPAVPSGYDAKQWRSTQSLDYDTFSASFFAPAAAPGPTAAQLKRWRGALAASEHQYQHRNCPLLEQRVRWFSRQLAAHPKTKVAYRRGALAASERAFAHRSCKVFANRAGYFERKLRS